MTAERPTFEVAYRAVLFAAGLIVLGLVFRQVVTLALAVLITVIFAVPLSSWATRLESRGIPRPVGAATGTDLRDRVHQATGASQGEIGHRVQTFVQRYTRRPERLVGPITSLGLSVAGIVGALVLMTMTAYFMAVRPEPLVT